MLCMVVWSVRVLQRSQKLVATLAQSTVNGLSGLNTENALNSVGMVSNSGLAGKQLVQPTVANHVKERLRKKRIVTRVNVLSTVISLTG
jgi:hypothetical protein